MQTLEFKTFIGHKNIGHKNFYWIYKHYILQTLLDKQTLELLLDIQTLDIKTFIGHTNIGYENFIGYKHMVSQFLLDKQTLDIRTFT